MATAISITAAAQQHVVTYYDDFKIHKKEVYALDKDAQVHGKYTIYWKMVPSERLGLTFMVN
jgi:hypothetical protein